MLVMLLSTQHCQILKYTLKAPVAQCRVLHARMQVEARLRQLEGRMLAGESAKPRGKPDIAKYEPERQGGAGAALLTAPVAYNPAADVTATAGKEEKKKVGDHSVLMMCWGTNCKKAVHCSHVSTVARVLATETA